MRLLLFFSLLILLMGCQAPNTTNEGTLPTERLADSEEVEPKPDYTGYQQSRQRLKEFGRSKNKQAQDEYINERTRKITNYLNTKDDINRSQVVETDDRIIAGVILSDYAEKDIADAIADDIANFIKEDKEVIVYTDYTYWYERIDRDASDQATELGDNLENMFDGFFHIAD